MNYNKVGNYIKDKRKERNLTQSELAEQLNLSFQTISKWETGVSLPDSSILIKLSEMLEVSVDKILNGGESKGIRVESIIEGFNYLEDIKNCFGENSSFYKGMIEGINSKMNIDILEHFKDPYHKEVMITEVILQYIMDGYKVDLSEAEEFIKSKKMIQIISDYIGKHKTSWSN